MELSLCFFQFMHFVSWLLLFHLAVAQFTTSVQPLCHDDERSALLQFKESLAISKSASVDPSAYPKIVSWKVGEESSDCCAWDGVKCNEDTGHVISLDLSSSFLNGAINSDSSLFHLVYLERLSLADNYFNHSKIPSEIMNLSRLSYLNLSHSAISGQILSHIPQLSRLVSLDLANNSFSGTIPSSIGNLTKLVYLDLSLNNFFGRLPASIGSLGLLKQLDIDTCDFSGQIPSSLGNLTQLLRLEISQNDFSLQHSSSLSWISKQTKLSWLGVAGTNLIGEIPSWVMNLTQLTYLVFDSNQLTGQIPYWLMNLNQLALLSIMSNQINGYIPSQIWNLTQLTVLDLSSNKLQGPISSSISELRNLEYLDLNSNNFSGTVELEMLISGLNNLTVLFLSSNNLSLRTSTIVNTVPQKFSFLGLSSCNLNRLPNFLQNQDQLELLDLSSNKIAGRIPRWLLNASKGSLQYLNLSYNLITGFDQHPAVLPWIQLSILDLRYNKLQGPLPIPSMSTRHYLVSNNMLTGKIPPWICKLNDLYSLDLSNNNLNGALPECLGNFSHLLSMLNLQGNKFRGRIPQTFMNMTNLRMIDLSHNLLQGKIPRSLANCTMLEFLDLRNNQIIDTFPSWLGILLELKVLILQSNRFYGVIREPETEFAFPKLRIIDLSHNRFTGKLPSKYFQCWNAIKIVNDSQLSYMKDQQWQNLYFKLPSDYPTYNHSVRYIYDYSITMTNKGIEMEYRRVSNVLTSIILSHNRFEGEIPATIAILKGLNSLNLSCNNLSGSIPSSLGNLTSLESLDLSNNMLSGEIPQQLAELTFLAYFNVSHNHLTGPIPQGTQFDTFENSSFGGNPGLCGRRLPRKCESFETFQKEDDKGSESPFEFDWKIVLVGYASGLIIGVVLGHSYITIKHECCVKIFRVQLKRTQRKRRHRN